MRYLLGNLTEHQENGIEEAFFADDAKFEELEMAEAELIDAYVHKQLSPEDQRRFEAKLQGSPRLLERVQFANLLSEKATASLATQPNATTQPASAVNQLGWKSKVGWWEGLLAQPAFRLAVAAGVFVILVGGVGLLFEWRKLRNESRQLAAERAALEQRRRESDEHSINRQVTPEPLPTNKQPEQDQRVPDQKLKTDPPDRPVFGTVTTIPLTPGSLRSGGGHDFYLGAGISTVQLKLMLENNDYSSYSVTIKSAEGTVIKRVKRLKARTSGSGSLLIFSIPAHLLRPGDYLVDVKGSASSGQFESVNGYAFRVTKK